MPIKFRCPHCQQFLGISRAKAGLVTDCPTCGRTIRVPNLDGSVEPLPTPKLDLADAGLRDALQALATLDSDEAPVPLAASPGPSAGKAVVIPPPRESVPAPVPIVLAPEPVQAPVVQGPPEPQVDVVKALTDLATATPVPAKPTAPLRRTGIGGGILALAVLGAFVAGIGLGYLVGVQRSSPDTTEYVIELAEEAPPAQPGEVVAAAPPTAPVAGNVVAGHLTYLGTNQQSLNDAGARILVLPEKLPGQSKLPVAGFRAGASEADRKLAEAAVEAIGGKFAISDKTGRFRIEVPPGKYRLLIMSRYSPRDEDAALIDDVLQLTRDFFDSPQMLIGQVNYHYQLLTLTGSGLTVNHQF